MAGVIAEWTVEATISNLVATAYNFIAEHSGMLDQWQQGIMEKELSQLRNQQLQIQSCLSAIEKGPITMDGMDPSLRAWLWQLRDAIDAADNLLDDIEYRRIEGRGNQEGVKVPSTSQSPTKYVKMMFKDIFGTDPLSKRLSEVVNQLNDVTSNINVIIQLALNIKLDAERMHLELARSRVTGPIQTERKFVGREKEREELKGWLLNSKLNCESDAGISPTSVLTTVGLGGVGKTTLVQEVYNDPEVREFFTRMIWVCVSNDFEPPQVLYKIMECAYGGIIISKENFSMIQEILQTKLISEKFLIVLDDVWEDVHFDRWEKLVAPLRYGQMGSKILVTTRMNSVAIMVKRVMGEATYRQIDLKSLHYQEFLPLFNRYAFSGVKIDNYKDLELLGQQFAKKLGGVPLLAKVIGGLLNSSLDHVQWKMILETDVMDLENGEKKVSEVLKLSYQKLPMHLQSCLRYCSLFPEDYKFSKDELVQMWMTAGLIRCSQSEIVRLEDVGEEHFNTLVGKSFFEEHPWGGCYMHDCLHQLVCALSREECFRVKNLDSIYVPSSIRHLSIRVDDLSVLQAITWPLNLRTLILELNESDHEISSLVSDLLKRLTNLRVLKLYGCAVIEFPMAITDLLHLRYLYFESDHCLVVPNYFRKLYHIQVIQIHLPEIQEPVVRTNILSKLIKLRYFMIASGNHILFASSYPTFGKLTSLQKLDQFTIKDEDGYKLEELKDLNYLRYSLSIDGLENVQNAKEGLNAFLKNKRFINSLSFAWSSNKSTIKERTRLDLDGKLLDCLLPHSELRELEIKGYNSLRLPYWLQARFLWNLICIKFVGCERLVQLPPLGQLSFLKFLYLSGLPALEKIGLEFYGEDGCGIFPALEKMDMECLAKCTEWFGVENANILFPCLSELYIYNCPQLRRIPALPVKLTIIELNKVGILSLPNPRIDRLNDARSNSSSLPSSLSSLEIRACVNLRSLAEGFLQAQGYLVSLKKLKIWYCNELAVLPTHGFTSLASLKILYLMCPLSLIQSLIPESIFPPSLEKLHIFGSIEALFPKLLNLTSLSALELGHSGIKSLPMMQVFKRLPTLEEVSIRHCNELISLGGLHAATYLKELSIKGCKKLETIAFNSGFTLLEKLVIRDCIGMKTLEILRTLTSLKDLTISRCPNLSSIVLVQSLHCSSNHINNGGLIALKRCWIEYCGELSSLEFLNYVIDVGILYIDGCHRLVTVDQMQSGFNRSVPSIGDNSLSVNHLTIDDPSYLLLEPLRMLNSIKTLHIKDCSQLQSLPEFVLMQNRRSIRKLLLKELVCLESLPDSLIDLSSLEELYLSDIIKLEALPLLPFSLKILEIKGCNHVLENMYRRKTGISRPNIDHVPSITIIPFRQQHASNIIP